MILTSLEMNNIRSYIDDRIIFPKGAFLLSGDIGSGKTTILLAIEFALFGLLRGEVSGASLLRHGCDKGFVSLEFKIGQDNYRIGRFLKRSSQGISQESGFIITNDVQEDLSASELKMRVLKILGYPLALASKGKNSLFRYTVYTPQEEMKRILLDHPDERVEVLRKVFMIEKYKMIQENIKIYARILREKCRLLEGISQGIEEKKKMLEEKESKFEIILSETVGSEILLQSKAERSEIIRKKLEMMSKTVEQFRDASRSLESEKSKIESIKTSIGRCDKRISEIEELPSDIKEKLGNLNNQESEMTKEIDRLNNALMEYSRIKSSLHAKIEGIEEISKRVTSLDVCPVCMQKVTGEHKHSFEEEQTKKKTSLSGSFNKAASEEISTKEALNKARTLLESIRKDIINTRIIITRNDERTRLLSEKKILTIEISISESKCKELEAIIFRDEKIVEEFTNTKKEFDTVLKEERETLAKVTSLRREIEISKDSINILRKDVKEKEDAIVKLKEKSKISSWISDTFSPMISNIERQVLAKIYHSLNDLFKEWFSILVSDDSLSVRLDDSFTPIITQNGFESTFESLSGGERTACALAYRLALNKVIGEIVGTIKTSGLIILDEPTEGFSNEQLDSLRDVITSLKLEQVCIVSHEPKIGGFVDKIIKVKKYGRTSKIICE